MLGNVNLELHKWNVDFAVWCSYKYLIQDQGLSVEHLFIKNIIIKICLDFVVGGDIIKKIDLKCQVNLILSNQLRGWQLSNPPILSLAL